MPDGFRSNSESEFRAESDLRTLMEAQRIQKDKARLARAMKMARKKKAELDSLDA
jgi:hypothetical protein